MQGMKIESIHSSTEKVFSLEKWHKFNNSHPSLPIVFILHHHARIWKVRREAFFPHGNLRTLTCGGKRSIGTQFPMDTCGQFYAEQMSVGKNIPILRKPLQTSMRTSVGIHADVRRPPCGRPQTSMRTSAGLHEDVRKHPCGSPQASCGRLQTSMRTSAVLHADVRKHPCGRPQHSMRTSAGLHANVSTSPLRMSAGLPVDVRTSPCGRPQASLLMSACLPVVNADIDTCPCKCTWTSAGLNPWKSVL